MGRLLEAYWRDEQSLWLTHGAFLRDDGKMHSIFLAHPAHADIELVDLADEIYAHLTLDVALGVIRTRQHLSTLQDTMPDGLHIVLIPCDCVPPPLVECYV